VKGFVLAAAVLLAAACGDATAPAVTQTEASPSTVATATTTTSPATVSPASAQSFVTFVNAPLTVAHGSNATLQVRTTPNTSCSIEVDYKSGPSTAAGLVTKSADSVGNVTWTWKVGAKTTPGSWPITVTCGGASGPTQITVT
jgi:hypothetical protein